MCMCVCVCVCMTVVLLTWYLKKYMKYWQIFQMIDDKVQLATLFCKQVFLEAGHYFV